MLISDGLTFFFGPGISYEMVLIFEQPHGKLTSGLILTISVQFRRNFRNSTSNKRVQEKLELFLWQKGSSKRRRCSIDNCTKILYVILKILKKFHVDHKF